MGGSCLLQTLGSCCVKCGGRGWPGCQWGGWREGWQVQGKARQVSCTLDLDLGLFLEVGDSLSSFALSLVSSLKSWTLWGLKCSSHLLSSLQQLVQKTHTRRSQPGLGGP